MTQRLVFWGLLLIATGLWWWAVITSVLFALGIIEFTSDIGYAWGSSFLVFVAAVVVGGRD